MEKLTDKDNFEFGLELNKKLQMDFGEEANEVFLTLINSCDIFERPTSSTQYHVKLDLDNLISQTTPNSELIELAFEANFSKSMRFNNYGEMISKLLCKYVESGGGALEINKHIDLINQRLKMSQRRQIELLF